MGRTENLKKVVVLIVCYNGRDYLEDCLSSLARANTEQCDLTIVVVDNKSPDDSTDYIRENFPECIIKVSDKNLGFAGGNNFGWEAIEEIAPDADFIYLLNQDTIVDTDFADRIVRYMNAHPECNAAQSLLLLHPETSKINTTGNLIHFLFFGLPGNYRDENHSNVSSGTIGFCSGASVIIRSSYLREYGLFTSELFMYLEDAELGVNLHLIGKPPHLCSDSIVFHKYKFSSTQLSYRYLERNRLWLMFATYKWMTLVLLLPAIIAMELGQWLYAAQNGLVTAKFSGYRDFLKTSFWKSLLRKRKLTQSNRINGDRYLLNQMIGKIKSPHLNSWLLRYVANPCFSCYFNLVKRIVFW